MEEYGKVREVGHYTVVLSKRDPVLEQILEH